MRGIVDEIRPAKYKWAHINRGDSYGKLGQSERAIEDYDKAIELDPDNAEAYNKLKMRIV